MDPLTRRDMLVLGASAAVPVSGAAKRGTLLDLRFNVSGSGGSACRPLAGAQVDVWHCDAQGIYSDVVDPSFTTSISKSGRMQTQRTNSPRRSISMMR
jgi:protocatechuate 3,4-dioxygenase beta subunit